jgi:hypothetical protein
MYFQFAEQRSPAEAFRRSSFLAEVSGLVRRFAAALMPCNLSSAAQAANRCKTQNSSKNKLSKGVKFYKNTLSFFLFFRFLMREDKSYLSFLKDMSLFKSRRVYL